MDSLYTLFGSLSPFAAGALASVIASVGTALGGAAILFVRNASDRVQDVLLGTAAGLMLGATAFSLVMPGIDAAVDLGLPPPGAGLAVGAAMMLGAAALWAMHGLIPHEHAHKGIDTPATTTSFGRMWLFILAITLHNFPEGLSVGVGFGGGNVGNGLVLTSAIFLQNLPEGFAVALAILALGRPVGRAVLGAAGTGIVETVGGLIGAATVSISAWSLPWALGGAAGAMLFVIGHEIIPETHRRGHETPATFGLLFGFALMTMLDVSLTG